MLSEAQFAQWLNRPEHFERIKKMAAGIQNRLALANLRLPVTDPGSDPKTILDEITQELAAFLLQTPAIQPMLIHDPDAAGTTVIRLFLNHTRDMIRSRTHSQDVYKDNWRAFRRHVLAVLGEADAFVKFPARRDMAFGLSDTARAVFIPAEKTAEIPFPADVPANFERMNQKKHILTLADHFWHHCAHIAGMKHVRMHLNEFLTWIGMYIPLQLTPEIPDEADASFSRMPASGLDPEKQTCLETWAGNFFNRLDDRQKQIFYYADCLGYSGKQVAQRLDRKSHLTYQRNLIREDLKQFLIPLDGLSPAPGKGNAPVDEDAFAFFISKLCAALGRNLKKEA